MPGSDLAPDQAYDCRQLCLATYMHGSARRETAMHEHTYYSAGLCVTYGVEQSHTPRLFSKQTAIRSRTTAARPGLGALDFSENQRVSGIGGSERQSILLGGKCPPCPTMPHIHFQSVHDTGDLSCDRGHRNVAVCCLCAMLSAACFMVEAVHD